MTSTLGGLLEHLEILRVLAAPAGLAAEVDDVLVYDPTDDVPIAERDLVLGVGVDERGAVELVRAAGRAGATGVAVKVRDGADVGALVAEATSAGVALLQVNQGTAWGQLYTLLRTAAAGLGLTAESSAGGIAVGDLFTLANAVAAMVGGPVTIESPQSAVLAYSSLDEPIDEHRQRTILGRRVPNSWQRRLEDDGVFHRLWGSEQVVRIAYDEPSDFRTRLAIAVRAGGQILGSIWVAEGRSPLGPEAEQALRAAAGIAALHLVRHQVGDDLQRRRNGELFRSVLDGRRPAELLAEPLNVSRQSFTTVLGFGLRTTARADLAVQLDRVASLVTMYAEAYRHQLVCTAIGNVVYVLLTDAARPDPAPLRRLAGAIVEQSRDSLGIAVQAGIGATVAGLDDLAHSHHEANLTLRVLAERGAGPGVATLEDVRAEVVLLRLRDLVGQEPELLAGKLDVLADIDAKKGHTSYLPTLRAYLDSLGDLPAAAASLEVHPNTYRYRLRRLTELAGIDLADPVQRLVLHLQLHLLSADPTTASDRRPGRSRSGQLGADHDE
ncbi:PucR family transcriptional regulator [Amycolatopsis sp. CA-230715]|uniref:PucR family transcriptional regulator n=1 Tax=Amycolatopsis sp. CA-230715 TaxID=2745196 RepID=UPI001C028C50|nr:helix-turn-helix domain-containing protein [Amycolatopsis sp. CA-230715]